jgi:CTP synthase
MQLVNDFQTSVRKALGEIDPNWESYPGLIICGTHSPSNVEEVLYQIQEAREIGIPFLGICMGLELMIIEYARNVLKIKDATSEEIGAGAPLVIKMPELRVGQFKVGDRLESHWHNYKFNPIFTFEFREDWKLVFEQEVLEVAQYKHHPFYVGVQFHPEYGSSIDSPHPLLTEFLQVCKSGNAVGVRP